VIRLGRTAALVTCGVVLAATVWAIGGRGWGQLLLAVVLGAGVVALWQTTRGWTPKTILAVGVALRVGWILVVPTDPGHDFAEYHAFAGRLAEGKLGSALYAPLPLHQLGYPLFLGGVYSTFGASPVVGRWMNVALALWLMLVVHRLARRLLAPREANLAVLAVALWPEHIAFTSLLASECLFLPLVWAGVEGALAERWPRAVVAGSLLGMAIAVRAPGLIAVLAVAGLCLWQRRFVVCGAVLVGVLSASVALWGVRRLTGDTVARGTLAYSALMGSNEASSGRWNEGDHTWYFQRWFLGGEAQAAADTWPLVASRWLEADVLRHSLKKLEAQWGAGEVGFDFAFRKRPSDARWLLETLNDGWALAMLVLALIGSRDKTPPVLRWLCVAPLGLAVAAHLVLEANPRYALPWLVGVVLLAAAAAGRVSASPPSSAASPR
jgi:hypothetical protein